MTIDIFIKELGYSSEIQKHKIQIIHAVQKIIIFSRDYYYYFIIKGFGILKINTLFIKIVGINK